VIVITFLCSFLDQNELVSAQQYLEQAAVANFVSLSYVKKNVVDCTRMEGVN